MENLKKHKGATGLHRAASKGNLKMVDLLVVYYKANVNMPDSASLGSVAVSFGSKAAASPLNSLIKKVSKLLSDNQT